MMCFGRRGLLVGLVLALIVVAALTTWWVLVALIPLAMMAGCMRMVAAAARTTPGPEMAGRWGCCAGGRPPRAG